MAALAGVLLATSSATATIIHNLGTLGGTESIGWGVIDAGQVAGDSSHSSLDYLTFAASAASHEERKRKKKECRGYAACGGRVSPRKTPRPICRCLLAGERNSHNAWYKEWEQVKWVQQRRVIGLRRPFELPR